MVKVSVIITTYNAEKSIAQTLRSVLAQEGLGTEFLLEILVVDDHSTDETTTILRDFNVLLLYTHAGNSGGPNAGRNIGLRHATGNYICFLDHDDIWGSRKIILQLRAAVLAPIVTCAYTVANTRTNQHIADNDGTLDAMQLYRQNETFKKLLSRTKGNNLQPVYLSGIMIHSDLKHILFEEHFGMIDFDWVLRLFEERASAAILIPLVSRVVNGSNLSLQATYRRCDYYYSLMSLETYETRYPEETAVAFRRINGSRARYFYKVGDMREARKYLLKAMPGAKEVLYYLTSFAGSNWVKRRFAVFG